MTAAAPAPARHLVVVDTETSGLRDFDTVVEVAWLDVDSGAHNRFVPVHDIDWVLDRGQPAALEKNGYRERIAHAEQDHGGLGVTALYNALRGQVLAGANPAFDAGHLRALFECHGLTPAEPWHHRLADVESYAAGALGIDPRDLPGLRTVCEVLGVQPGDHTAAGDVRAAAECFAALDRWAAAGRPRRAGEPVLPAAPTWADPALDDQLVARVAASIHRGASDSPWASLTPVQQHVRLNQARGVVQLVDRSRLTAPGGPGHAPAPAGGGTVLVGPVGAPPSSPAFYPIGTTTDGVRVRPADGGPAS